MEKPLIVAEEGLVERSTLHVLDDVAGVGLFLAHNVQV